VIGGKRVVAWLATHRDLVALPIGFGTLLWAGPQGAIIFFLAAILIELVMLSNTVRLAYLWAAAEKKAS
jgi:hypothetical protein